MPVTETVSARLRIVAGTTLTVGAGTVADTGPGSGAANATELCKATGGTFNLTLIPVGYACVFLNPSSDPRATEAKNICTGRRGTFVNLLPLSYACILPLI